MVSNITWGAKISTKTTEGTLRIKYTHFYNLFRKNTSIEIAIVTLGLKCKRSKIRWKLNQFQIFDFPFLFHLNKRAWEMCQVFGIVTDLLMFMEETSSQMWEPASVKGLAVLSRDLTLQNQNYWHKQPFCPKTGGIDCLYLFSHFVSFC